jgi:hypothetical protein
VWFVGISIPKYNSSHRRHEVGGSLKRVVFETEMTLATLTQCETRWILVLTSFGERWEKLIADHPDAKEEMDLLRVSVVWIEKLLQNSPKVNGNGAKWKQLADRAEASRHTICKFLDGQALFTGLIYMYTAPCKEMTTSLQPSSKELGQEDSSQAEQNNRRKVTETLEVSAAPRNRRGHLQLANTHGRWRRITPLRHSGIYLWKIRRRVAKETPLKLLEQMKVRPKVGHLPSHYHRIPNYVSWSPQRAK